MKKTFIILSFLFITLCGFAQPNIVMKDPDGVNIRSEWGFHLGLLPIMTVGPWRPLVIKNTGTADLVLADPSTWELSEVELGALLDFEWDFTQVSTTIAPGDSTFVYVRYAPKMEGGRCIWIDIPNNDPDATRNPFILVLCGLCTTPDISVHPGRSMEIQIGGSYTFYSVPVGYSTYPIDVDIKAHGPSEGIILYGTPKIQKVSGNVDDFVIDESMTSSVIETYNSTKFTISFRPLTTGKKSMVIRIPNSDFNEGDFYFTVYAKTGNLRGNGRVSADKYVNEEDVDDSENQLAVYPNPSAKNFTISTGGTSDEQVAARIFNTGGTLTEKFLWPGGTVQTVGDDWKSGLYLLEIRSSTGRKIIKLVKE
jgi:hypothetical protein